MYYATYFSQFHFLTYLQCNGIHVEYLHHNFFFILYTSTCIYKFLYFRIYLYIPVSCDFTKNPTTHQINMVINLNV